MKTKSVIVVSIFLLEVLSSTNVCNVDDRLVRNMVKQDFTDIGEFCQILDTPLLHLQVTHLPNWNLKAEEVVDKSNIIRHRMITVISVHLRNSIIKYSSSRNIY